MKKVMTKTISLLALLITLGSQSHSQELHDSHSHESASCCSSSSGHSGHLAPAGVMGDHAHPKGELMFSYRYMFMPMDGNRTRTNSIETSEVLSQFAVAPEEMTMQMHMIGVMYGATDNLTLMASAPIVDLEMEHVTRMGMNFTTRTSGIGDVRLAGILSLGSVGTSHLSFSFGLSAPTGSIDETGDTPMGTGLLLPYPMQLGSGAIDLFGSLSITNHSRKFIWGAQGGAQFSSTKNDRSYRLGNRAKVSGWVSANVTNKLTFSLRPTASFTQNINGASPTLNPMMVPTANPNLRSGEELAIGFGSSLDLSSNSLTMNRFAFEIAVPVYRNLDGPQLETDWSVIAGWQIAFDLK